MARLRCGARGRAGLAEKRAGLPASSSASTAASASAASASAATASAASSVTSALGPPCLSLSQGADEAGSGLGGHTTRTFTGWGCVPSRTLPRRSIGQCAREWARGPKGGGRNSGRLVGGWHSLMTMHSASAPAGLRASKCTCSPSSGRQRSSCTSTLVEGGA